MSENKKNGWIGFDFDGTLATYEPGGSLDVLGKPLAPMVALVKRMLAEGEDVRIVTARACNHKLLEAGSLGLDHDAVKQIQDWCEEHIGKRLPVQFWKDYSMKLLFDDRAVQVATNEGYAVMDRAFAAMQCAEAILMSGVWTCAAIPEHIQKRMWAKLADALGIPDEVRPKSTIIAARKIIVPR